MKRFETIIAVTFGVMFLSLALLVSVETVARKLFNVSFQGVDELGGYCLAAGGALTFSSALLHGAHIRIDLLHARLPSAVQVCLNALAVAALLACSGFMVAMASTSFWESVVYQSTVMSPWSTPLRYPQSVWLAALSIFAALSVAFFARLTSMLFNRQYAMINRTFSPFSAKAELAGELADLRARGVPPSVEGGLGTRS